MTATGKMMAVAVGFAMGMSGASVDSGRLLAADVSSATTTAPAMSVERTKIGTLNLTVKLPDQPARGKHCLWVGEFGGHLRSLEDGLVEKGLHVVYLQYGSQFGSPAAVKAGVFLISCHGTADRTVPDGDNTAHLVDFWEKSRGRFKVFAKQGGNHHPHGLPDPAPLIELLCAETK